MTSTSGHVAKVHARLSELTSSSPQWRWEPISCPIACLRSPASLQPACISFADSFASTPHHHRRTFFTQRPSPSAHLAPFPPQSDEPWPHPPIRTRHPTSSSGPPRMANSNARCRPSAMPSRRAVSSLLRRDATTCESRRDRLEVEDERADPNLAPRLDSEATSRSPAPGPTARSS